MQIEAAMDTGPVFMKSEIPIPEDKDAASLSARLSELGAEKLVEALDLIGEGRITAVPQDHEKASLAPMLTKDEGRIDWGRGAREIHNLIRGLVPWPCAYTSLGGKTLKILSGTYTVSGHDLPCGTLQKDGAILRIACRDGFIIPGRLQLEGRKTLDARSFSMGLHEREVLLAS
jgi:methionyl-tRNA formyltransferase